MKNLFLLVVCFFLMVLPLEAAKVHSVQDGDFFDAATWENNQLPNLTGDSIVVQHDVTFNQVIQLSGKAHLKIEFCERLCGNFNLYIGTGASMLNEGGLFTDSVYIQGNVFNYGRMECTYMKISAGGFKNANGGSLSVLKGQHDCSIKFVPSKLYFFEKVNTNTVRFDLKCPAEIDFGDTVVKVNSQASVYHSFPTSGIFNIEVRMHCSCDTASFTEKIEIVRYNSGQNQSCTSFSLYPNPNNGEFRVKMESCEPDSSILRVPLYNSAGQHIRYVDIRQNNETLIYNLPLVASGVYYLAMPAYTGIKPQKIVIIK